MYSSQSSQYLYACTDPSSIKEPIDTQTRSNIALRASKLDRPTYKKFVKRCIAELKEIDFDIMNVLEYKGTIKKPSQCKTRLTFIQQNLRSKLLPEKIKNLSLRFTLDRAVGKLPNKEEIKNFINKLENFKHIHCDEHGQKTISFAAFMAFCQYCPKNIVELLQPIEYFQSHAQELPVQPDFCLPINTIIEFVSLKRTYNHNRIIISGYDTKNTGLLTREQLCDYYANEIMPMVDILKNMEEPFRTCYLNTIESLFFFFLDLKHNGYVRINDIIISGFVESVLGLQINYEDYENWFSPEKTHELNAIFQMLDSKQKNFLDKEDFKQILDGSLTSTFVERLFETRVMKRGEKMTYEEFVIFQIAYNHLAHPASICYFFKILDVDQDGFLSKFELRYFYTELRRVYNGWFMDGSMPEFEDFADQFFDMVKPKDNGRISQRELLDCKQGHDFILSLINYLEFYRYETKDSENSNSLNDDSEMPLFDNNDSLLPDLSNDNEEEDHSNSAN